MVDELESHQKAALAIMVFFLIGLLPVALFAGRFSNKVEFSIVLVYSLIWTGLMMLIPEHLRAASYKEELKEMWIR